MDPISVCVAFPLYLTLCKVNQLKRWNGCSGKLGLSVMIVIRIGDGLDPFYPSRECRFSTSIKPASDLGLMQD